MNISLKNTFRFTVGTFCLVILTQVVAAQSGGRNSDYQQRQTTLRQSNTSSPNAGAYGDWQGTNQRPETSQIETRLREPRRVGFEQYDHLAWDGLLQKYVDQKGDVDYASWQTNQQDRSILVNYLRGMNNVDTSLSSSPQSQMAFWINAYNALTIEGILQLFPTKSIKDHAPDANGFNIWDHFTMPVGGTEYSLNDIEHNVLRKMGDPRIHFAIVCASKSCPQLSQRAYFADSLDRQLAYSTGLFFHTPDKFSYDVQRGLLGMSPIIKWFGEDFGRNDQERLQYLSQFMPVDAGRLASSGSATINYLDYDWGLNVAQSQFAEPGQFAAPREVVAPTQSFAPGQNVSVRALRAQGSGTRQSAPTQNYSAPGSGTRQTVEAYRPTPSKPQCGKGSCSAKWN